MRKKFLSTILAAVMLLSLLPAALATGGSEPTWADAVTVQPEGYAVDTEGKTVTISTAGVVPVLKQIAGKVDVALALSLHAPDDELRDKLVPLNRRHNIASVLNAVRDYVAKSNANCGRVTIEYVLLDHVNDSMEQAEALARLLKDVPCKINLIPFNPHDGADFNKPSNSRVDRFCKVLMSHGYTVITRTTRGDDIAAACGQLAGQVKDKLSKIASRQVSDGDSAS